MNQKERDRLKEREFLSLIKNAVKTRKFRLVVILKM